jgi:RNA polymerase sigma factor (sigma-70 family)
LDVLTPLQRQVVVLRYFGDKSHAQIAETLGKREGAVRGLLTRALQRMRTVVRDATE